MSKVHIATIITLNHYDKALTMFASANRFRDCHLHILIVDRFHEDISTPSDPNITVYRPNDISEGPCGRINRISLAKYREPDLSRPSLISQFDYLRWSLKPGFVSFLHQQHDTVMFCDSDLFFYNDFSEMLEKTKESSFIVSPHWRTIHTIITDELQYNFRHGLYNGGYFIATKQAEEILLWWAERCCVECSATSETTYVDQKYLDLVPLYFDNVHIIRHKGYNVAAWNAYYLPRTEENGEILVAGYPIIFIHYSPITICWIRQGLDLKLAEHLREYDAALLEQRMILLRKNFENLISEKIPKDLV